jgi:hypothetical protein
MPDNEIQSQPEPPLTGNTQEILFTEKINAADTYNPAWAIYVGATSVTVFIIILLILFFIKQRR